MSATDDTLPSCIVALDASMLEAARDILREYGQSLSVDLSFQGFDEELASLPGEYGPPEGLFVLALVDGAVAGCGGFRRLNDVDYPNACEMKRLYVRRPFRRFGLGRAVAQHLMDRSREAGYSTMLLDTLDDMETARELYASLGFVSVPPYYFNPLPGAHYLCADLGSFNSRY